MIVVEIIIASPTLSELILEFLYMHVSYVIPYILFNCMQLKIICRDDSVL